MLWCVQEKQRVEGMMEQQASEIQALRQYEQQLSAMSHALSKMEGSLRQEQEEKVGEEGAGLGECGVMGVCLC